MEAWTTIRHLHAQGKSIRSIARRLHSAISYITPKDKLEGRAEAILAERGVKLAAARQARKNQHQEKAMAGRKEGAILGLSGASGSRESLIRLGLLSNSR